MGIKCEFGRGDSVSLEWRGREKMVVSADDRGNLSIIVFNFIYFTICVVSGSLK